MARDDLVANAGALFLGWREANPARLARALLHRRDRQAAFLTAQRLVGRAKSRVDLGKSRLSLSGQGSERALGLLQSGAGRLVVGIELVRLLGEAGFHLCQLPGPLVDAVQELEDLVFDRAELASVLGNLSLEALELLRIRYPAAIELALVGGNLRAMGIRLELEIELLRLQATHIILRPLYISGLLRKGPCARQFRLQPRDHAPSSVNTAVDFLDLIEKIDLAQSGSESVQMQFFEGLSVLHPVGFADLVGARPLALGALVEIAADLARMRGGGTNLDLNRV